MYIVKFVMFFSLGFSCDDFPFLLYFDSHLSLVSCLVLLLPSCLDRHHQLFPAVSASLVSGHCLPVYILSSTSPLLCCTFPVFSLGSLYFGCYTSVLFLSFGFFVCLFVYFTFPDK